MSHFRHHYPQYSNLFFAPINEGNLPIQYRQKLDKMGQLKGMSDLVLLLPVNNHPFALFELKRKDKSKSTPISKEQKDILNSAADVGAFACVCYGFDEFKKALFDYMVIA